MFRLKVMSESMKNESPLHPLLEKEKNPGRQASHEGPPTPGRQAQAPVTGSHAPLSDPTTSHWQLLQPLPDCKFQ